jgi:transcriptional regulator with XRE-family HTH domain
MKFGKKLDRLLQKNNMKSCALAIKSGLTPAAISKILSSENEPKWDTAQRIIASFPDTNLSYWHNENGEEINQSKVANELAEICQHSTLFNDSVKKTLFNAAKLLSYLPNQLE